jgi:Methyltransferase domain
MIKKHDFIKIPLKSLYFLVQSIISKINSSYNPKNEYGRCSVCGNYAKFEYIELFNKESKEVKSCNWDEEFTTNINLTNSLICKHCYSKFRIRCTADVLLKHFREKSVKDLTRRKLQNIQILETGTVGSVFATFRDVPHILKSEYYDNVPTGKLVNGVRCEDLQKLTFDDNSLDVIISLDVFEHIPEPFKAFSEVLRVLKPGGIAIITFPVDKRNKETKTVAELKDGNVVFHKEPSYHSDPIRDDGSLVFTEFGMDILDILTKKGFNAELKTYFTEKDKGYQFVLTINK